MRLRSSIGCRRFEVFPNRFDDHRLDFSCRHPAHRSCAVGRRRGGGRKTDSIGISRCPCGHGSGSCDCRDRRRCGRSARASDFIHLALWLVACSFSFAWTASNRVPIENGGLLALEDLTFEGDFSDIEAIAEELRERAARERDAADASSGLEFTELGDDAPFAQIGHQQVEAAELEIAAEDGPDPLSLGFIDSDLAILGVVTERAPCLRPRAPCVWRPRSCRGCARR